MIKITFGGNSAGPPGLWLAPDAPDSANAASVAAGGVVAASVVGALMRRIRDALVQLRWPLPRRGCFHQRLLLPRSLFHLSHDGLEHGGGRLMVLTLVSLRARRRRSPAHA